MADVTERWKGQPDDWGDQLPTAASDELDRIALERMSQPYPGDRDVHAKVDELGRRVTSELRKGVIAEVRSHLIDTMSDNGQGMTLEEAADWVDGLLEGFE